MIDIILTEKEIKFSTVNFTSTVYAAYSIPLKLINGREVEVFLGEDPALIGDLIHVL